MTQKFPALATLAALRSQPWAIERDYLLAAEAILARVPDAAVLQTLAIDGHAERHQDTLRVVAALGQPLAGTQLTTIRDGVAVVPVLGVIAPRAAMLGLSSGGTALDALAHDLRAVEASTDVREVMLLIDSPGGSVTGTAEVAGQIAALAKPTTAYVQGSASSGAYWIASQAKEIVTAATGHLGSIGVVLSVMRQVAPDRDGRQSVEIVSSGAPDKRADPTTDEGRIGLQALVDSLEREFVDSVAAGRGVSAETVRRDFGRGGVLAGREAVAAGMADRIDTLTATLDRLAARDRQPAAGQRRPTTTPQSRGAGHMDPDAQPIAQPAAAAEAPATPPAPPAVDPIATERARVTAILAAQRPHGAALAQLAVAQGWSPEVFAQAQTAAETGARTAAAEQFRASLPAPVATGAAPEAPQAPEAKAKAEWDANAGLRAEFGGNLDAYLGWVKHGHKARRAAPARPAA